MQWAGQGVVARSAKATGRKWDTHLCITVVRFWADKGAAYGQKPEMRVCCGITKVELQVVQGDKKEFRHMTMLSLKVNIGMIADLHVEYKARHVRVWTNLDILNHPQDE